MGKSTETLQFLTNEQKALRDNLRKSGLGYNGPYVLSQAYAKIPKLYRAYELCDQDKQLHVFDSEDTLEDAEQSRLKMNEFQKDEKNKDLHDETKRISKESKDVSNESKTADAVCNDAFEVTQELSKRIVELEKKLSKFEAKSIAFEIALKHKSRENNSLKTLQKENENFMESLQIKNAHLKQTYKNLFDLVQRSRETNHCDEVKLKVNFDELKTKNIELEHRVESLIKENEHLKLTYQSLFDSIKKITLIPSSSNVDCNRSKLKRAPGEKQNLFENEISVFQIKIDELEKSLAKQTKENSDLLMKIDNLENVFVDEEKMATFGEWNAFDNENCDFGSKIFHLEKIIAQKSKDFEDVNLELSIRTAKFEAYFEKLETTKVVLERKLAHKVDDSKAKKDQFLKEINHLRIQHENLNGKSMETKFDKSLILGKPPAEKLLITSQLSKLWFTPKIVVQKDLSKPVTAQS
nr:pyruvate, phosphate dikinase regulatory protein, chloroplastic [Tanacetum cinerariifolium]